MMTVAECKKMVFPWVYKLYQINSDYLWYNAETLPEKYNKYLCVTCDSYKVDSFKSMHWSSTIPPIPPEAEVIYVYKIRKEDYDEHL